MTLKISTRVNQNGRRYSCFVSQALRHPPEGDKVVLRIEDDELRIATLRRNLERAQRLVRKHVKSGTSPVDELIAERRKAARRE